MAKAEQAFDQGVIWDDTGNMPLLYDDFEEKEVESLVFTAQEVSDFSEPDASVKALKCQQVAFEACRALLVGDFETASNLACQATDAEITDRTRDLVTPKIAVTLEGGIVQVRGNYRYRQVCDVVVGLTREVDMYSGHEMYDASTTMADAHDAYLDEMGQRFERRPTHDRLIKENGERLNRDEFVIGEKTAVGQSIVSDREEAIRHIENLYPADADYEDTAAIGRELLAQAKREVLGWRNEPTAVLIRYAELCTAKALTEEIDDRDT
ncbi:MAG: hypothetical protein ACU84J_08910 [Gammaproteobacteria bacterium]